MGNAPPQVPPELVELDQEDDDEQDFVMTDTADINHDFIRTGYILFIVTQATRSKMRLWV